MPLTDIEIRRTKAKAKPYKVSDGRGMYLWVTPAGGKVWRWNYRHDGKQKVMTFPKSFYIPTPVGHYSPDWAIAFKAGTVRHIYFIAETKGSL
jgi:restriction endonuclease